MFVFTNNNQAFSTTTDFQFFHSTENTNLLIYSTMQTITRNAPNTSFCVELSCSSGPVVNASPFDVKTCASPVVR